MKKSEFVKEVKNYIYEILSEEPVTENFGPAVQSTDPAVKKIEDKINKDKNIQKQIAQIMAQAEKGGDTTKLFGQMTGLFESEEDKEPTKAELEKEKVKGAPDKFKISDEKYKELKDTLKKVVEKVKDLDKKIKDPDTKKSELEDLKDQKLKKMATLKQFIQNPELKKAFKERDVKIDTGELIGENKNKLNEAQHLDIAAVISQIREFNRGNIDMEHLVKMTLKNLGYKPTSNNIKNTESHYLASMTSSETIPQDAQIVRELFDILK